MCSAQMVLIILIGIATIETVSGFSGGSVEMSCGTMLPQHASPTPESGPLPFSVTKHFCSSAAGDETIVTLQADPATPFRGFLLEARESQDGLAVGSFTLVTPTHSRLLQCNGNPAAAVTQSNNQAKTNIQAKWRAPGNGVFYFRVTFIKDLRKFWKPEAINITTCPTITTPTITTPTTITTLTIPPITTPTIPTPTITAPTITTLTIPPITTPTIPTPTITTPTITTPTITTPTITTPNITPITTPNITPITTPTITTITTLTIPPITTPTITTPNITTPIFTTPTTTTITTLTIPPITTPTITTPTITHVTTSMLISTLIRPSLLVMSLPKGRTLWHKGFKILLCPLSMVAVIIAFILLLLWEPLQITLVVLVGVAMILSLGQTIVVFLPFGPSHELRSICDLVLRVIAFTTEVFTMAAIFVGLGEIEKCCSIHWLMKVMGGYAAWVALFYLMFIYLYCNQSFKRKEHPGIDYKWIVQKRMIHFEKILKVILVLGNLAFTVALIIGIYTYET